MKKKDDLKKVDFMFYGKIICRTLRNKYCKDLVATSFYKNTKTLTLVNKMSANAGNVTNEEDSAVIKKSTDQQNEMSTKPEIIKNDELNAPTTTKLITKITRDVAPPTPSEIAITRDVAPPTPSEITITRDVAPPTPSEITSSDNNQQQQQSAAAVNYSQFSHPVYKKISAANGRINRMSKDELIDALKYLGLNPK